MFHWRNKARGTTPDQRAMIVDQWAKELDRWLGRMNRRRVRCYRCQIRFEKGLCRKFGTREFGSFGFLCERCRKGLTLAVLSIKD